MKRLSELAKPVDKKIVLEWEDIQCIIKQEDIQFGPGEPATQAVEDAEVDLNVDLSSAVDLLSRVSDMFQCLPCRWLESYLSSGDYQSIIELDRDVATFLEDFDMEDDG